MHPLQQTNVASSHTHCPVAKASVTQLWFGWDSGSPGADESPLRHGQGYVYPILAHPLKWHGGKRYLARRIVELMPTHTHYVEPFAGGLSVLLAKNPDGISEVANDLNGWLMNFWAVLRHPVLFPELRRVLEATPFAEPAFLEARGVVRGAEPPRTLDPVEAAAAFMVCCRQSLAGRMGGFTPLSRRRTRRGMNEQAAAWLTAVDGLPAVHRRLRRVAILNKPAVEVLRTEDGAGTLFYLDPPYHPDTRSCPQAYGEFDMTATQHVELLAEVTRCRGKVMISGYDCPLYEEMLPGWTRHTFDVPNNAAGLRRKRRMTEVLWCNFTTPAPPASADVGEADTEV
jgi:DNA adenine methylase